MWIFHVFTAGYTQSVTNLQWGNGWWIEAVCAGASHCAHSVTAHPRPQWWHGVSMAMELVVPDPELDMAPSGLYPRARNTTTGVSMNESVQLEPSVVWNTTVQSSQTRNEDGSCISHCCGWCWTPAPKGADTCKVLHFPGEVPWLGRWRGAQTPDAEGLKGGFHAAVALWHGQKGFCPPIPAMQRLQFVLSLKPSDSWKTWGAVPSPPTTGTGSRAAHCHPLFCDLLCYQSTEPVHNVCGNHLNSAPWICSRGRGRQGTSFSPFFNITHTQQKCIGTFRDFRGETSSTLALNRLLSNLILVSKESSFLVWRRLTGSHAHFLCHLHSLKAEVKQKDMKTFIPGTGKQGDVSGLQSAINYNNFGNKLPSRPPF